MHYPVLPGKILKKKKYGTPKSNYFDEEKLINYNIIPYKVIEITNLLNVCDERIAKH